METVKKITEEMRNRLKSPLPPDAIKQHPTKTYLSTIKAIYVIERLNDVFGVGGWTAKTYMVERLDKWVVVKGVLSIPDYNIEVEAYGGNDHVDLGDAHKGASTDFLTKAASYLEIGIDVFKGKANETKTQEVVRVSSNNGGGSVIFAGLVENLKKVSSESERVDWLSQLETKKKRLDENEIGNLRALYNIKINELTNKG